jgi:hypothetical protein
MITGAAAGLALLAAMVCGLGLLLHSEASALRAGRVLQYGLAVAARLARRAPPASAAGSLSGFRDRAGALLVARGWRITAAIVASHLMLWLVLLACLRAVSLSQAQLPWQTSLAAFAFIRLLTAMPITPGGLGITELGLIGILAGGAGHKASAQVTAAVLIYRAVTYLPSIPLGALAYLTWRYAPALISTSPRRLPRQAHITTTALAGAAQNGQGTLGPATIALVAPACARDCDSGCSGPRRHLTIQVGQVMRHDNSYPPAETNAACSGRLDAP